MRELWHTGRMHNRVRMLAASFLVKHLMIPAGRRGVVLGHTGGCGSWPTTPWGGSGARAAGADATPISGSSIPSSRAGSRSRWRVRAPLGAGVGACSEPVDSPALEAPASLLSKAGVELGRKTIHGPSSSMPRRENARWWPCEPVHLPESSWGRDRVELRGARARHTLPWPRVGAGHGRPEALRNKSDGHCTSLRLPMRAPCRPPHRDLRIAARRPCRSSEQNRIPALGSRKPTRCFHASVPPYTVMTCSRSGSGCPGAYRYR